jgi:hypothetical protein
MEILCVGGAGAFSRQGLRIALYSLRFDRECGSAGGLTGNGMVQPRLIKGGKFDNVKRPQYIMLEENR